MKMLIFGLLSASVAFAGTRYQEDIRLKVKEHLNDVKMCYDDSLKKNPKIKGKVLVDWTINDKGAVTSVSINKEKTTLMDAEVQKCIVEKFNTWSFPPAPTGESVTISFPFTFDKK